jgi:ribosomal protein S18 acetylase RimI-like enzyme
MGKAKGDVRRGRGGTASGRSTASSVEPRLRAARPADSAAVAELLGELGYPSTPEQAAERIERIAGDPATWLVAAELDGEVAGFGVLHVQNLVERDEPGVEVAGLAVGGRFRRRGIGELLMQALRTRHAREAGR